MLLRRVIEHVKTQNWTAVALDFVIVVVGVFIGIQVSNWNAARQDHRNEARYLAELAEDLEADIAEMDQTLGAAANRVAAVEHLFREMDPAYVRPSAFTLTDNNAGDAPFRLSDVPERPTDYLHSMALNVRVLDGNGHTFEELVTTGNLGILKNRALVRALTQYYSEFESEQDGDRINRHLFLRTIDFYVDRGVSPLEAMPIEDFIALVQSDPALQGHLKAARDFGVWQWDRTTALKAQAQAALDQLNAERGVAE